MARLAGLLPLLAGQVGRAVGGRDSADAIGLPGVGTVRPGRGLAPVVLAQQAAAPDGEEQQQGRTCRDRSCALHSDPGETRTHDLGIRNPS